ncbi:sugar transferase [Streptosporangium sp. NBC_01756]|uniref:sugar transferase n=1 Tax=Streptosporangium sp. NBC_01756 TaxID=2975950 RepID=UPI002DDC1D2A|nr:sugar transferase [Streptosporangium sp. NBC_01756]WSC87472.1 sugar transferase [Streptosporangium sp. NBC_01756]
MQFNPETWVSAGGGVREAADDLARGVDAFCRVMDERPFGQDDLGRALFEGDPAAGVPGFARLRDDLLKDLVVAVNLLRGMAAGLAVTGGRYAVAEEANAGIPCAQPCPGWLKDPEEYRPRLGSGGLPTTTPPPGFVSQAIWFLESVGFGSAWPDGDLDGVARLRDAATALGRVVGDVREQIAGQSGRAIRAGSGPTTAAFGRAAWVVHGEQGQLADLQRRCRHLADCGQIAYDAIVKARWRFVASAVFVLTLMLLAKLLAPRLGPLLDVVVKKLLRAEGLALRIILLIIRQAALGAMFSGGLSAIDQLFTTGDIDAAELVRGVGHGALAGGLMAGAHAALPALLRRGGPALTGLAEAMESATWERAFSRILVGGTVSSTVLATAGWASGAGWNWKHAAEMGFGMAVLSTGAALASRAWPAPSYASLKGRDWKQSPAKRWHDVKWALGILTITAPAVSVFALAKFAEDRRNPFFLQKRVGQLGHEFDMAKGRSMRTTDGKDSSLGSSDSRRTRVGEIWAKTSLDEFVQLAYNVLYKSNMSVINDRPLLSATRQETIGALGPILGPGWSQADLAGKPGLFGPFPNKTVELNITPKSDGWDVQRGFTGIWHDKTASLDLDRKILWEFISTYRKRIS